MPGIYLKGWDATNSKWVKITCDANGRLIIDPALILENPPTEDEATKAATSEWCFDHNADVAAHHAKYTAVEARAAINDIFGADGKADSDINMDFHYLNDVFILEITQSSEPTRHTLLSCGGVTGRLYVIGYLDGTGYQAASVYIFNGTAYEIAAVQPWVTTAIETHCALPAAHHAKYTDLEAQTACNLNGTLYYSCAGINFDALSPDIQDVTKNTDSILIINEDGVYCQAAVSLPNGATVTGAICYGNAASEAETWYLRRVAFSNKAFNTLATAVFNTEDTSINNLVVDNSLYAYFLTTTTMDTADEIWGARITYTL